MATEKADSVNLRTGILVSSEYLLPGGSNLLKGDLMQAGLHTALGFVAKSMFGLPGLLIVSANSVSKALTGSHLFEHLNLGVGSAQLNTTKAKVSAGRAPKKAQRKTAPRASKKKRTTEPKE